MTLFDDLPRDLEGPADHTISHFDYLNRSARPAFALVRAELERWFANYPEGECPTLRNHLRTRFDYLDEMRQEFSRLHESIVRAHGPTSLSYAISDLCSTGSPSRR